ncbi:hypothetical protein OTU49_009528 [Cherax quadricarinatus]|uniref:Mitochondrial sodium/hydrogen exchanger NHA2 n=1 Tax=Cherax quadricarinatus TaxID=27406 RepID=A0AAW0WJP0_CHEQU
MLGLTFAKGALIWTILEGPTGMVLGILCGIVFAILCWYLPYKEKTNRSTYKFVIIFSLSALAIFGSHRAELESSGPILVLTLAFVAGLGWRKLGTEIGATDPGTIGWGMLALLIGVAFRIATSFVVVMGASLTAWERLFIAIAWLPKATVQAAIGSQALDHVLQHGGDDIDHIRGQQVVTLAVMAILLTAPLGAVAVRFAGPRLLAKCQPKP